MERQIEISDFKTFIIIRCVFLSNRVVSCRVCRERSEPKYSQIVETKGTFEAEKITNMSRDEKFVWFISEIVLRALEFN